MLILRASLTRCSSSDSSRPKLAQTSYLIGCPAARECIVIDPNRDADQYMKAAEAEGVRIAHVTETHIHADYLSGSRELAARTGATLYLSDEGDAAGSTRSPASRASS